MTQCRRAKYLRAILGEHHVWVELAENAVLKTPRSCVAFYPLLRARPMNCERSSWNEPGSIDAGPRGRYSQVPYHASGSRHQPHCYSVRCYREENTWSSPIEPETFPSNPLWVWVTSTKFPNSQWVPAVATCALCHWSPTVRATPS